MQVTAAMKPYRPYGAAEELFYSKAEEIGLSGPAGTGKSRAELEKLHVCAEKYAGMRGLIIRKTRASLTDTGLVTFERDVIPDGHPALAGPVRRNRGSYKYPNGSELVVGGLDNITRIMSGEYDLIYLQEAIEASEDEFEKLTTRLRNGRMPYQQLLFDTNPDRPTHWLKQRANAGTTLMLESRHEDNPRMYDHKTGEWTPDGRSYLDKLDRLTGPRKLRLRFGLWAAAEGLVYEEWDPEKHIVSRFEIPADWPRYWTVDFGYTNPFVWKAWAESPDGDLYRYHEIYMTGRIVSMHAEQIRSVTGGEPAPVEIICDHDAEDRATLEDSLGVRTEGARKEVSPGIQALKSRLQPAGNGKPRIYYMRDSLVERDEVLAEKKLPTCTEEEYEGYCWDQKQNQRVGERPIKAHDHGLDCDRYLVYYLDGSGALEMEMDDEAHATFWSNV